MGFFGPGSKDARRKDVWALEDEIKELRKELTQDRAQREEESLERQRELAESAAEVEHQAELDRVMRRRAASTDWWRGRPPAG